MNATIAGYFGVPVALISGDADAVAELKALVPTAEGAVVKRAISFHAAATIPPAASQELIRTRAKAAIEGLRAMKPFVVPAPIQLELTYKNYTPAEMMAYLPGVDRVDSHTIRYTGRSIIDVSKFMGFAMGYRADLTP